MNTNKFTVNNIEYTMNPETGYCIKTVVYPVEGGKTHRQSIRIGKGEFAKAMQEYDDMMDAKMHEAIERLVEEQDNEEIARIQQEMAEPEKAPKTKKSTKSPSKKKVQTGGMEFSEDGVSVILTPKQVAFVKELPTSDFWENGLDSALWVGVLCDELSGKMGPMTVGAMISTLREKHLLVVGVGQYGGGIEGKGRKSKYMELTELGKKVAAKVLGL